MNRWLIVVGREYKTRVRKRAFILSTLLGPFLMVGIVAIMVFLAISTNDTDSKVLIVDHNNLLTYNLPGEESVRLPSCPECFPERDFLEYRFASMACRARVYKLGRRPSDIFLQHFPN